MDYVAKDALTIENTYRLCLKVCTNYREQL